LWEGSDARWSGRHALAVAAGVALRCAPAIKKLRDHELELCRQHNRQITRLLAFACLAPLNGGGLNSSHIHGTSVPVEEPSTALDEEHSETRLRG
jgi:hypothetical protein